MTIRTFTREQLDSIGVPFDLPADPATAPEGAAIELHDEQIESRRWVAVHELVFRAPDDGKAYRVRYERGLTEMQEDTDPWDYAREVKATEVVQRAKTTMSWEPVADAATTAAEPVDLSKWAAEITGDQLEPLDSSLSMQTSTGPLVRILFAVRPDMPEDLRNALVEGLAVEIAKFLPGD